MKEDDLQAENLLGMKFRERKVYLGGEKVEISQERSMRVDLNSQGAYIQKSHKAQSIESYRALKRRVLAIEPAIENLTRGFLNNEAQWIEIAIEETESFLIYRTSYQDLSRMR